MSENNFAASIKYRQAASTTIAAETLVCIDTGGLLQNAADTAGWRFAGVNQNRSVASAEGLGTLGGIARADVYLQGKFMAQLVKAGTNPDVILDSVYARSATTVQDATGAVNDVYVGRILKFLNSANPVDYRDDTSVTATCYVLVGYDVTTQ